MEAAAIRLTEHEHLAFQLERLIHEDMWLVGLGTAGPWGEWSSLNQQQ